MNNSIFLRPAAELNTYFPLRLVFSILFVLGSQVGLTLFNKCSALRGICRTNEVIGIFFGAISLLYSLILAFVIVAVWTNYDELDKTIESETDKLNSILAHSAALPEPYHCDIKMVVRRYCEQVVDHEWKMVEASERRPSAIPQLRTMLLTVKPEGSWQENAYSVIEEDLSSISELRQSRLNHNRSHIPPLVWLILKSGSIMLVVFSYFFDVASISLNRICLLFLSTFIAMCMYLVYTLDHPFAEDARVSCRLYEIIILEAKPVCTNK